MILFHLAHSIFLLVLLVLFWTVFGIAGLKFMGWVKTLNPSHHLGPQYLKENVSIFDFSSLLALGMTLWFCAASFLLTVGYFNLWAFALIFSFALFAAKSEFKNYRTSYRSALSGFANEFSGAKTWDKTMIGFIILFILLSMMSFVAPLESDGAAYYLPIAKLWADSGLFRILRGYDDFSAVGAFAEIQLATIYLFQGEWLVRGFSAFMPLLISLELYKFAKKLQLSFSGFLIQVLALYTSMCVMLIMYSGKIDLFSAWLGLLAMSCLFFDRKVYRAGLFLAAACIAKLSLLLPMFFVGLTALIYRFQDGSAADNSKTKWRLFLVSGLKLVIPFLLVFFWQLLKNQFLFENPFAPFIGNRIGEEKYWYAPETIARIKMLYPLVWFFGDFWGQLGSFSILVLMFLPFAWIGRNSSSARVLPYWISMFLVGMLMWFFVRPSFVAPRYIMGFFLIAFPLMGLGYDWYFRNGSQQVLKIWFTKAIIVLFSLHLLATYLKSPLSPKRVYRSWQSPQSTCKVDGPDCTATQVLNEAAEPGSRVLQLMYETIWLRPDLVQTLMSFNELDGIENLSSDKKWQKIVAHDFDYIILKNSTHTAWVQKLALNEVPQWVVLKELYNQNGNLVLKIELQKNLVDLAIAPAVELVKDRHGWHVKTIH